MSYILDALKKSDEERRRRKPSGAGSLRSPEPVQPVRTMRWRYIIAAALFLNAGLLVWWLRPWQTGGLSEGVPEKRMAAQTQTAAKSSPSATAAPETISPSPATPAPAPVKTARVSPEKNSAPPAPAIAPPPAQAGPPPSTPDAATAPSPSTVAVNTPKPADRLPDSPQTGPAPVAASSQATRVQVQDTPPAPKAPLTGESRPAETPTPRPASAPPPAPVQVLPAKPSSPAGLVSDEPAKIKEVALQEKSADIAKRREKTQQKGIAGSKELIMDLQALTGGEPQTETATVSRKALRYHELSSQVRGAMPKLSISMLLYSKKSGDRWINVNGTKMREGQEVSAGLKVEEITPEGAVFTYQGQRFYKAVMGD